MQLQKLFNSNVVVVQSREGGTDAVSLMSTNDMILAKSAPKINGLHLPWRSVLIQVKH